MRTYPYPLSRSIREDLTLYIQEFESRTAQINSLGLAYELESEIEDDSESIMGRSGVPHLCG